MSHAIARRPVAQRLRKWLIARCLAPINLDGSQVSDVTIDGQSVSAVTMDGEQVFGGAIPDSDVYLHDDWGDNKLQNRDGSGTTTYNGVEGVYRPEWNVDNGSPTVSNATLSVADGGILRTNINLELSQTITWEWTDVDVTGVNPSSGANQGGLTCFSQSFTPTLNNLTYEESYGLLLRRSDSSSPTWIFFVEDGGFNSLLEFSAQNTANSVIITRSPSGVWEVIVDGDPKGTVTDTRHTSPQYCGFGSAVSSSDSVEFNLDQLKVK